MSRAALGSALSMAVSVLAAPSFAFVPPPSSGSLTTASGSSSRLGSGSSPLAGAAGFPSKRRPTGGSLDLAHDPDCGGSRTRVTSWLSPTMVARDTASSGSRKRSRKTAGGVDIENTTTRLEARSYCRDEGGGVRNLLRPRVEGQEHAYEVVFVRHGQSTWNKANRFIGWTDAELTEEGEVEARVAGQILLSEGFEFDIVYTSMLKRAIKTAWVVLDELSQQHVPVMSDWHLNERCYGALVGREKKECVRHFGAEQVKTWRRSYDIPPPPIDRSSELWPGNNPRYDFLMKDGTSQVPLHESLKDVMKRASSYWDEVIAPSIRAGDRVCVCGHENNLRSLLKHIDGISDTDIMNVELPRAVPLVYYLDKHLKPIALSGAAPYLSGEYAGDPEEIAAIMDRDVRNVYDLSVSDNLEEAGSRFAAKLEELSQPCSLEDDDEDDDANSSSIQESVRGAGTLSGAVSEKEVGEPTRRNPETSSTPVLIKDRHDTKSPPS